MVFLLSACQLVPPHRPTISVVMSTYHRADTELPKAIDSILNQTYRDFEFIIINDGSPDQTATVLQQYQDKDPRIRIITNDTNIGLIASLNKGLDAARGKYIARMDDDDISDPTRFAKQVAFLDTHPDITATGCAFATNLFPEDPEEARILTFTHVPVLHPCAMIRRDFVEQHHIRYIDTYLHAEDMPFWRDVTLKYRGRIANLPDILLKKGKTAFKKENYRAIQKQSVDRYRQDTFNMYLKPGQTCDDECECWLKIAHNKTTDDLIRPEVLRDYLTKECFPPNAIRCKHPGWSDLIILDSKTRAHRRRNNDMATILRQTPDTITLKWDDYGIESFRKQPDKPYYQLIPPP